jgi:hypothetical protein
VQRCIEREELGIALGDLLGLLLGASLGDKLGLELGTECMEPEHTFFLVFQLFFTPCVPVHFSIDKFRKEDDVVFY